MSSKAPLLVLKMMTTFLLFQVASKGWDSSDQQRALKPRTTVCWKRAFICGLPAHLELKDLAFVEAEVL